MHKSNSSDAASGEPESPLVLGGKRNWADYSFDEDLPVDPEPEHHGRPWSCLKYDVQGGNSTDLFLFETLQKENPDQLAPGLIMISFIFGKAPHQVWPLSSF